MNIDYETDFDLLIDASIKIGNMMQDEKVESTIVDMHLAEGLGKKIIDHIISTRFLIKGYQLSLASTTYMPKIDIASIAVQTRAAMETYLTLNHVFVAKGCNDIRELRFLSWDLAGYIERSKFIAKESSHIELKQDEKIKALQITEYLKSLESFKKLNSKHRKNILNGNWRGGASWHDLAIEAGFNSNFFSHQYKYLCSYAHSGRLSIIQIQQNETLEKQREMARSFISTLMMILAKNMVDYIRIFPSLDRVKNKKEMYSIIYFWNKLAEQFEIDEKK